MSTGSIRLISDNAYMATYVFTEDSKSKNLERVAFGVGQVSLPGSPQIDSISGSGLYPTSAYSVISKNTIVCKTLYSASNISSTVRMAFYDDSDTLIGFTEEIELSNTGISEGNYYVGDMLVVSNVCGASSVKLKIDPPTPSGTISVYLSSI